MNAQEQFWAGDFGNAYTERNRVDWWARMPFWAKVMAMTCPRSVGEVGCNAGWNLMAIRALTWGIGVHGVDVNERAVQQAQEAGLHVEVGTVADIAEADLIFTAGVLIHVAPDDLPQMIRAIADKAGRYVLAVEYEASYEQAITYRGHTGQLWKRPYGQYLGAAGLTLIQSWQVGEEFDNCWAWLMEKP